MYNLILNRLDIYHKIKEILLNYNQNKDNNLIKKGIYIYGNPGIGKTSFVNDLLKDLNFDIIKYDGGDVRNKNIIEMITKHNMSDKNVLSLLQRKSKSITIIMDEIDGMNNGDKGGINTLIKLIRPKKTKKQKNEESTSNPIICIGNYHIDKKIKELMKVCHVFELKTPTNQQIKKLIDKENMNLSDTIKQQLVEYISGDLRKLQSIKEIYGKHSNLLKTEIIQNIFQSKIYNDDSKKITENLLNNKYFMEDHSSLMNETDRTIVGLLFHENVIDVLQKIKNPNDKIILYHKILNNICYADNIDRITFQKQIWLFNEMSSLIKILLNNKFLHDNLKTINFHPSEIRFTKVLTKYSTEYNNSLFIQNLCCILSIDEKDLFTFFIYLKQIKTEDEIIEYLDLNQDDTTISE
jgi:DNA polymerase III delta prime subunit